MTTKRAKSKPTECRHLHDILLKMSGVFACCKLKPPERINVKHLYLQRPVHFVRASRVTKIKKKRSGNQRIFSNRGEGDGGGGGVGIKTKTSLTYLILIH